MSAPFQTIGEEGATSVRSVINLRALNAATKPFLIDPDTDEHINSLEAQHRIKRVAAAIASRNLPPGSSVAYACQNGVDAATAILGIMYGGYLAVAVNLVAGESAITYALEHSETKLVIADENGLALIESLKTKGADELEVIMLSEIVSLADRNEATPLPASSSDGLLMYTSGTTGKPKGVVLTHKNLLAGGQNTAMAHSLTPADRGLCVLPLYHINALCVSLMGALVSNSSLVVPSKFSASSFWGIVRKYECSWFSVVPTQISYLLHNADKPGGDSKNCDKLRFGRSASAPLSPSIHSAFEERFEVPIIETMGLTETAAQILSNPLPPKPRKIGSPGVAVGNEVMIADANLNQLQAGQEGEVLVRGPNVMRCYLKNEEATSEAISMDGWLRTGDLGKMDDEGYVYITGRLKELIIKGGENIAPREVDEALYSHPDVVEAAAFPCECADYGQRVEAGVMLSEGSTVTEAELISICSEKIGKFKAPDRIHFLPELPKGPSGKIQRIKLAQLIGNESQRL